VEYDEDSTIKGDDYLSRLTHAWEGSTLVDGKPVVRTTIIRSGELNCIAVFNWEK